MAKTIKFTLICDGFPARTIEDLQDHFVVAEMLNYYRNGILRRWLEVRGYLQQADAVSKITCTEPNDIVNRIFDIFQINHREVLMQKYTDSIKKQEEDRRMEAARVARLEAERLAAEQKRREEQEKQQQPRKTKETVNILTQLGNAGSTGSTIISAAHQSGYKRYETRLLLHPENAANVKECIVMMTTQYADIFAENHQWLFEKLQDKSLLALLCLLMNPKSRPYFCPYDINGNATHDDGKYPRRNEMFMRICEMCRDPKHLNALGHYLKVRSYSTEGKFQEIEPARKKCMLLSIGAEFSPNMIGTLSLLSKGDNSAYQDRVRSANNISVEYEGGQVMNRFMIFDGIQYIHWTTHNTALLYLEV